MANKPSVTLTFAGDEKQLTEAFDRVGAASKSMADKVDDSSKTMRSAGERFETATESFDTLDTRAMGFRDTLTGLQDGFKGLTDDSDSLLDTLLLLGFGIGDLASGFVNFLLPMLKTFWTTLVESVIPAVWSFTTALLANPITWVVLGIAALIGILYLLGVRWDDVKNIVGNVIDWIVDRWNGLMSFFAGIPDWFGRLGSAIGNAISAGFKGAINWIVDRLNWLIDVANKVIYGINVINPFSDIPDIPHIPRMHTGGVVGGPPGSESLAILQAGEEVTSAASAGGSGAVALVVAPGGDAEVGSLIDRLVQTGVITAVQMA